MSPSPRDSFSIHGATLPVQERTGLLVVGAGPAGLSAAIAAVGAGIATVLVDENPVPFATMAEDVPQFFGGRMSGAARNPGAMMEAFVNSDPLIAEAFEAGVDLRLGTTCWGLYANGPDVSWLPGPVAGLHAAGRSTLLAADRILVAAGRRDVALAFDGWEQAGVMGMEAALRLQSRYGALDVRRAVVLGTTAEAVAGARQLAATGVEVLALVEPGAAPLAPAAGLPLRLRTTIRRAESGPDGVRAAVLAGPDGEERLSCDAVIVAIGTVPAVELLDAAHCPVRFDATRGGPVPTTDAAGRTGVPGILAAGDCAGTWPAKSLDPAVAAAEGRRAALGLAEPAPPPEGGHDLGAYRAEWVRSALLESAAEPHVCRCEEVTAREILEVRPPRYLGAPPRPRNQAGNRADLRSLLGHRPAPDQVKRLTRAGMGLCQGRRCREQVAVLTALGSGVPLAEVPLATHRAPVRPLPLSALAPDSEHPAVSAGWDVWFGMKSQYQNHWTLPDRYTVAGRKP